MPKKYRKKSQIIKSKKKRTNKRSRIGNVANPHMKPRALYLEHLKLSITIYIYIYTFFVLFNCTFLLLLNRSYSSIKKQLKSVFKTYLVLILDHLYKLD